MTTRPERPAMEVTAPPEQDEVVAPEPQVPPGPVEQELLGRDIGEADLGLADRQSPDDS